MILLKLLRGIFAANRLHDYTKKDLAGFRLTLENLGKISYPFYRLGACLGILSRQRHRY